MWINSCWQANIPPQKRAGKEGLTIDNSLLPPHWDLSPQHHNHSSYSASRIFSFCSDRNPNCKTKVIDSFMTTRNNAIHSLSKLRFLNSWSSHACFFFRRSSSITVLHLSWIDTVSSPWTSSRGSIEEALNYLFLQHQCGMQPQMPENKGKRTLPGVLCCHRNLRHKLSQGHNLIKWRILNSSPHWTIIQSKASNRSLFHAECFRITFSGIFPIELCTTRSHCGTKYDPTSGVPNTSEMERTMLLAAVQRTQFKNPFPF